MTYDISGSGVAYIGDTHGYCFDGDSVRINAALNFSDAALGVARHWALQLWAGAGMAPGAFPAGVKVAELAVYPAAGWQNVDAVVTAMPPAGFAEQSMALALVSWVGDDVAELADLKFYPAPERFAQPCLRGNVARVLKDGLASLSIEAIENPRAADNLSGTLALEVWALDSPYAGGSWQGVPVASLVLGVLAGGNGWTACEFEVPAAQPASAGALTVMLREWSPAGYVTRDYRNLEIAQAVAVAVAEEKPVAAPKKPLAKAPAKKAAKAVAVKKAAPAARPVSVNSAGEAEMMAIKGLSTAVAKAIIAGRPYKSLDDLCRVKGMGPKLLAKVRDQLAL